MNRTVIDDRSPTCVCDSNVITTPTSPRQIIGVLNWHRRFVLTELLSATATTLSRRRH